MTNDYTIRDKDAKIVTIVPEFGLAFRYLKHHQPDGEYSVVGPGCDCTINRANGILYPTSGTVRGVKMTPMRNEEAKEFYGNDVQPALVSGEVWNEQGKVAGAIPPLPQGLARPGTIPFRMIRFHPATDKTPEWIDMFVNGKPVRMNPEIGKPPYFRLFDCVAFVHLNHRKLRNLPNGNASRSTFQGQTFLFWYENKLGCVMVDTQNRIDRWNKRDDGLLDGGHTYRL